MKLVPLLVAVVLGRVLGAAYLKWCIPTATRLYARWLRARCDRRERDCLAALAEYEGRSESGIVLIEWILGLGLILLPVVGVAGAALAWPGRLNAAHSAAYEAAKAVVEAPDGDEGLGQDRAVEVWTNHGYDAGDISVSFSGDPATRGGQLKATVTITLPVVPLPGVGSHAAAFWSTSHTERVADYRGFG